MLIGATTKHLTRTKERSHVIKQRSPDEIRVLDRRLQEDLAKDVGEGPRVLMSLRVDFESIN